MTKPVQKTWTIFSLAVVSCVLHNFYYGIFHKEDAIFFILTFVFLLAFIILLIDHFIKTKKYIYLIIFLLIIISFILVMSLMPHMPDQMASHWNANGEVDGYMSKRAGLFLMPLVLVGIFILFAIIPKIDPLKKNIEKFRKYFDWFVLLIVLFLLYIYVLTLIWNLGIRFNMTGLMVPALGLLFLYVGILLKHAKRNWFVGIRTPWTLSSDKVWKKTHELGAVLYIISGLIALLGIVFSSYAIWFVLVPILAASLFLIVYSYFEYKKEKGG